VGSPILERIEWGLIDDESTQEVSTRHAVYRFLASMLWGRSRNICCICSYHFKLLAPERYGNHVSSGTDFKIRLSWRTPSKHSLHWGSKDPNATLVAGAFHHLILAKGTKREINLPNVSLSNRASVRLCGQNNSLDRWWLNEEENIQYLVCEFSSLISWGQGTTLSYR